MLSRIRGRMPRHSTIAAYAALFTALGGVSYAAVNLPKNSVGASEIEKNAVRAPEIKANAVGTGEVKDSSLLCQDFAPPESVCKPDAVGLTNTTVRTHTETVEMTCTQGGTPDFPQVNCTGEEIVQAPCAPGERATGGGYQEPTRFQEGSSRSSSIAITEERPDPASGTPTAWAIKAEANGFAFGSSGVVPERPPDNQATVYAVCAA